jgi:hypothetical protein
MYLLIVSRTETCFLFLTLAKWTESGKLLWRIEKTNYCDIDSVLRLDRVAKNSLPHYLLHLLVLPLLLQQNTKTRSSSHPKSGSADNIIILVINDPYIFCTEHFWYKCLINWKG